MMEEKRHRQRWFWLLGSLLAAWWTLLAPAQARPAEAAGQPSCCMVSAADNDSPNPVPTKDINRVDTHSLMALPVVRVNLPVTFPPVSVPVLITNFFRLLPFRQPVRASRLLTPVPSMHRMLAHQIAINAP